jgi:hypothetical protein
MLFAASAVCRAVLLSSRLLLAWVLLVVMLSAVPVLNSAVPVHCDALTGKSDAHVE